MAPRAKKWLKAFTSFAEDLRIKEFDSETKRLTAVAGIDPEALRPFIYQMVAEAAGMTLQDQQKMHGIIPAPDAREQFEAANAPEPQSVQ